MSRGGGSFRGGRGGPLGPPGSRLNHGTMPFEITEDLMKKADTMKKAEGLWPAMSVPRAEALEFHEAREVANYIQLRSKIRLGPYHRQKVRGRVISRPGKQDDPYAAYDALVQCNTYRNRQSTRRRVLKEMRYTCLPWNKDLLPQELWGVCGLAKGRKYWPKSYEVDSTLSTREKLALLKDDDEEDDEAKRTDGETVDENDDSDDEEGRKRKKKDDDSTSELGDDDFEDDESDFAPDYNAEQYFDGGEDDGDDMGFDDAGGGGDWA